MTAITESRANCAFILSEAPGHRSRENGVAAEDLTAGTVVESEATDGSLTAFDGTGTVVGIVLYTVESGMAVAYLARDAEVNQKLITSGVTDGSIDDGSISGLADLGIICRD